MVPGAISAWRRRALIEACGFPSDTLAEDADATIALERRGWRVIYEPAAAALTEAPETLRAFLKQRFRWVFGTLQVAHKHAGAVLRGQPLGVALITVPNVYIFQMGFALLAPLMDAALVLDLARLAAAGLLGSVADGHLGPVAEYWLLFQALDVAAAAAAIHINGAASGWKFLPLTLLQRICYRQLLYIVALRSIAAAVKGHLVGWGKLRAQEALQRWQHPGLPALSASTTSRRCRCSVNRGSTDENCDDKPSDARRLPRMATRYGGCGPHRLYPYRSRPSLAGGEAMQPVALAPTVPGPASGTAQAGSPAVLHCVPGDRLKITFYERVGGLEEGRREQVPSSELVERAELTGEYVVQLDGTVFLPCLGPSTSERRRCPKCSARLPPSSRARRAATPELRCRSPRASPSTSSGR